ncbi:major facilitator superfamily domain-containing protein [Coniochaeta sp. 2T2.1]|nr:major facilitator superfamily domain-containing protein [Coniochaeta sp. 2T2.1]
MAMASSSNEKERRGENADVEDGRDSSASTRRSDADADPEKRLDDAKESSEDDLPDRESEEITAAGTQDADDEYEYISTTEKKPANGLTGVLSRVISRASTVDPGPPPDGGRTAWMMVLGSHLIVMNTWGFINTFGVFQTYYVTALHRPPSDISWIGSVQIFLLFLIGTLTGRATDAGYFRLIMLLGSAFQVIGIFTSAQATQYWQLFLSQGICMGLGNGFMFCPTMAVLSTYFAKKKMFVMGIAACGSATGGLVFPVIAREMLPSVGFAWTMRTIGFIQLAGLVVANWVLKARMPPRRTGALVDWAAFGELEYVFYAAGAFFTFTGLYFPFYYIASFSRDIIGMSYTSSLNLLLVMNGCGVIGRLGPNLLADRVGPITVFLPVVLATAVCMLCWMAVTSIPGLYVWSIFYGMAAGGIQSLFPACLTTLTTDLKKAGVRMGMIFTINSFATLMGPPIAGAIITSMGGSYKGAQGFAGAFMLVGMGFTMAARTVKVRRLGEGFWAKI